MVGWDWDEGDRDKVLSFFFVCLSLPMRGNPKRVEMCQLMINKFSRKLVLWKHKNIFWG